MTSATKQHGNSLTPKTVLVNLQWLIHVSFLAWELDGLHVGMEFLFGICLCISYLGLCLWLAHVYGKKVRYVNGYTESAQLYNHQSKSFIINFA